MKYFKEVVLKRSEDSLDIWGKGDETDKDVTQIYGLNR